MSAAADATPAKPVSLAAPFRHPAFAVIWTATLVSNVGSWMYSAASAWLMTSLNPDPLIVALVQAASTAADLSVRAAGGSARGYFRQAQILIVIELLTTAVSAIYAVMVGLGLGHARAICCCSRF